MSYQNAIRRALRATLYIGGFLTLAFAAMTFAQAWSMTHYQPANTRTTRLSELSLLGKARLLTCGPNVRRQSNIKTPADFGWKFETRHFNGARGLRLEAWRVPAPTTAAHAPGVLMFPGYAASKDTLLPAAREFAALGCHLWLIDPHGIGGSEGATTSVGFHEAEDVAAAFREAARLEPGRRLILYGTAMGAVAILRAVHENWVQPDALVLECPFDRFTTTIGHRFAWLGLPPVPFAQGVAFWTGVQQGFNGLAHNPADYARAVRCPSLLLQGECDESVGRACVSAVAHRLGGESRFELIPGAGHSFLVTRAPEAWRRSVRQFLATPLRR